MQLNGGAVDSRNRRCACTNLHGIATQTTVVIKFINTLIFTIIFVMQFGAILNKADMALCDDLATSFL